MKNLFLFLVLLIPFKSSFGQNYEVGITEYTFTDSDRSRSIPSLIYYPSTAAGENMPVANSQLGFPVISFGHGLVIEPQAYGWLGEILAAEGYIFVMPATEGQLLPAPDHLNFGLDILFCAEEIIRLGSLNGNALSGKVLPRYAMMGHSMGGGATYLGASQSDKVTTTITFAAAETNPSAINAAQNVNAPSLVLAAEEDCVTPFSSNQLPIYTNLSSQVKAYANFDDASHCNFTDGSAGLCYLGEAFPCLGSSFITLSEQHNRVLALLLPWLDQFLRANCSAGELFIDELETGNNDNRWTSELNNASFLDCAEECAMPSNLVVLDAAEGFDLSWADVEDALGYQIQARLEGTQVGSINSFDSFLTVSQLSNSQAYEFRVRAFCPVQGWSDYIPWTGSGMANLSLQGDENLKLVYEGVVLGSQITIQNFRGEPVEEKMANESDGTLNLSSLPKGFYVAKCNGTRKVKTLKFAIR